MICISPHRNNCDSEVVEIEKGNGVVVFLEKFGGKKIELLKSL